MEESGEGVKFFKGKMVGSEVDIECNASGTSSDECNKREGGSSVLFVLHLGHWLSLGEASADGGKEASFFLRCSQPVSFGCGGSRFGLESLPDVGKGNVMSTTHVVGGCFVIVRRSVSLVVR